MIARKAIILFFLLFLVSCSGNQWYISGAALNETGKQFVSTGNLYNDLFNRGKVTKLEYRSWSTFARRFQLIYGPAVNTWIAAQTVDGKIDAANALRALRVELISFLIAGEAK